MVGMMHPLNRHWEALATMVHPPETGLDLNKSVAVRTNSAYFVESAPPGPVPSNLAQSLGNQALILQPRFFRPDSPQLWFGRMMGQDR